MADAAPVNTEELLATVPAFLFSRQYNLIATGDETALQLGVDVRSLRRWSYAIASVITGAVVSTTVTVPMLPLPQASGPE